LSVLSSAIPGGAAAGNGKLTGGNEAQRNCRPVQRLVSLSFC